MGTAPNLQPRLKVLLTDDHALVLDGVSKLLQNEFELVGTANSGSDAIKLAEDLHPDIVFMDISMPGLNGFDASVRVRQQVPNTRIIALTMHQSTDYWRESIRAGMVGYILKQSAASELKAAMETVMRNEPYVTPLIKEKSVDEQSSHDHALTERQRQVLRYIAQGCIAKEIGAKLQISVRTAEFHRVSIMQKLGLSSTAELTRYALENGIAD